MLALLVSCEACFFALAQRRFEDQGPASLGFLVVRGARVSETEPSDPFIRRLETARAQGISAGNPSRFFLGYMVRESFAFAKDPWIA